MGVLLGEQKLTNKEQELVGVGGGARGAKSSAGERGQRGRPTTLPTRPVVHKTPTNATWSQRKIQSLTREMGRDVGVLNLEQRKQRVKDWQREFHPDKNPGKEDEVKPVFQHLMQKKEWFCS